MSKQAPTYDDFITEYPEFSPPAVFEADVQRQLDFAIRLLSRSAWGDWYSDGILLVAAHSISMRLNTQSAVNGSSVIGSTSSKTWYNRTMYGQKFLYLQSLVV